MVKISNKELVQYWQKTAEHDWETVESLWRSKKFDHCLFFCHIVLEKILKALVVLETKKQTPKIHNLVRLVQSAKLNLPEKDMDFLAEANRFNIRTRYPDFKFKFYKQCTKDYTQKYLDKTKKLYKELCQILKEKK